MSEPLEILIHKVDGTLLNRIALLRKIKTVPDGITRVRFETIADGLEVDYDEELKTIIVK